jgi:hypothetical protein
MEVEMNQDTVANRLKVFVSSLGAMKKDVLEQAGIHTTQFSRVLNGHQQPGFTFLLKFTTAFPELNLNWLLTGQGESETQTLSVGEKKLYRITESFRIVIKLDLRCNPACLVWK